MVRGVRGQNKQARRTLSPSDERTRLSAVACPSERIRRTRGQEEGEGGVTRSLLAFSAPTKAPI